MSYIDDSVVQLKIFEGSIAWLYLDTRGKVTAGVGLMLPNLAAAQALPFHVGGIGEDTIANAGQVEDDWNRVTSLPAGRAASFYHSGMSVFLEEDDINTYLMNTVKSFDSSLRSTYPSYDSFPDPAKLALIDMAYNLGMAGLAKFTHMNASVIAGNWAAAATECHRNGPSSERNAWTVAQFTSAATATA